MTIAQQKIGSGYGARSTADEILSGIDLTGKLAIVTGGYSGIGLETTRALRRAGADVLVPARRPDAARAALGDLDGVEVDTLDPGELESVRAFADGFGTCQRRHDHDTPPASHTRRAPSRRLRCVAGQEALCVQIHDPATLD